MDVDADEINERIAKNRITIQNKLPQDICDLRPNIHLEFVEPFLDNRNFKHQTVTLSERSPESDAIFIEAIRLQKYYSVHRNNSCLIDKNNKIRHIELLCTQTHAEKVAASLANSIDN